jgi:LuxR family maltose regulon positive regulatory protein
VAELLDRHPDLLAAHAPVAVRLAARCEPAGVQVRRAARLPEPITQREEVVLQFLPTLLTTDDIARELSVSPNTVKTHLRNIYRKLSVGTRRDAVHRARTLGLLHP